MAASFSESAKQDDLLSFEAWMQCALFDPHAGYYSAHIGTVGRHGDFSTSATTDSLLAKGIAAWICRQPQIPAVIEVGGGDGRLMEKVREVVGWRQRWRRQWHMVEVSPVLKKRQQERLGSRKVRWHDDLPAALQACHGRALIYHNELVDAFPVKLLQWDERISRWQEVYLQKQGQSWQEVCQDLPVTEESTFSALLNWREKAPPPQPRQRIELHQQYRGWLRSWSPFWKEGAMLTIDYGDTFPQLYYRCPLGTLRAYCRHQRLTGSDLYLNMGRQDITTDVNFTDLISWGGQLGWTHAGLKTQRDFLLPLLKKGHSPTPAEAFLLDEYGAGVAFKVLEQHVQLKSR